MADGFSGNGKVSFQALLTTIAENNADTAVGQAAFTNNVSAVSNLQPTLTITQLIATEGIFPGREGGPTAGNDTGYMGFIYNFAGDFGNEDSVAALGQTMAIQQNTALFSLIGTTYGGNGTTSYMLPNLSGAIGIGQAPSLGVSIGSNVGSETFTLGNNNLPASVGGSGADLSNLQPSLGTNYLINTSGPHPSARGSVFMGQVVQAAFGFTPDGYMPADGRELQITEHWDLFQLLGTVFGGNGSTTFRLPDLRGRTAIGTGNGFDLGDVAGTAEVDVGTGQLPALYGGTGASFDNRQPSLALHYYIAAEGVYPSRDGNYFGTLSLPVIGQIVASAVPLPTDQDTWLPANGQVLPIDQNQALFSLLGTNYGGDGRTNFALPSLGGRSIVGAESGGIVGFERGSAFTALTVDQIPLPNDITFSLGGEDAAAFNVDSATGALTFKAGADFESASSDGDDTYEVSVTAASTRFPNEKSTVDYAIAVTDAYEGVDTVPVTVTGTEDTALAIQLTGSNPTGSVASFTLGTLPAGKFYADAAHTQELKDGSTVTAAGAAATIYFVPAENANGDITFTYAAVDGDGNTDATPAMVKVTLTPANDAPFFTTASRLSVDENTAAMGTVAARDVDAGDTLTFSLDGGDDAALFAIDGKTGALSFKTAPDFEKTLSAAGTRDFAVTLKVTDGANASAAQHLLVELNDLNDEAPLLAASKNAVDVNEGTAATGISLSASDADAADNTKGAFNGTFELAGDDAALFTIDAATGALSFKTAPDFEAPGAKAGGNVYSLSVTAKDGAGNISSAQALTVAVKDLNDEAPVLSVGSTMASLDEGTKATTISVSAKDADSADNSGGAFNGTFVLGGDDGALFELGADGKIAFRTAPDYETPASTAGGNTYSLTVAAKDGAGNVSAAQTLTVTVDDVNDTSPFVKLSALSAKVTENTLATGVTITVTDPDTADNTGGAFNGKVQLGGADAALFKIDNGAVVFAAAPDFERPASAAGTNEYRINVSATDAAGGSSKAQIVTLTVTDANDEAPVMAAFAKGGTTLAENTTATGLVARAVDADAVDNTKGAFNGGFVLGGDDAALFSIDAAGAISFRTAPNFEAPGSKAGTNTYSITVAAKDAAGNLSAATATTVKVADAAEAATFGAVPAITLTEDGVPTATGNVSVTDEDAGESSFQAVTVPAASLNGYGAFTITAGGAFSYTLSSGLAAVQALNAGQSLEDSFTVRSTDGTPLTLKVTINGADEVPPPSTAVDLVGSAGIDYVALAGEKASFTLTVDAATDLPGSFAAETLEGTLSKIERVAFSDGVYAYDVEGTAGQVYRLYQAAFDRTPDTAGLSHNIRLADGGQALTSIAQGFIASAEFQALVPPGSTDVAFVTALYRNVLDRAPDAAGLSGWLDAMAKGMSWAQVLVGFSESAENKAATAAIMQDGILMGEDPASQGVFDGIEPGLSPQPLYGGRAVDYGVFIGEVSSYTVHLAASTTPVLSGPEGDKGLVGVDRALFSDAILAFDANASAVYRLYEAAFNRVPDVPGLSANVKLVDAGRSLGDLADAFVASAEFTNLFGPGASDTAFIAALYQNVLERAPDDAGLQGWLTRLSDGSYDRGDALLGFSESAENRAATQDATKLGILLDYAVLV